MAQPKSVHIPNDMINISLIVPGQGVFLFNSDDCKVCSFSIQNADQSDGLLIEWTANGVKVLHGDIPYIDPKNSKGLTDTSGAYYWFSIDAQNQVISAGVGEARQETIVYYYKMPYSTDDEHKQNKAFIESLTTIGVFQSIIPIRLLRDPITKPLPYRVKQVLSLDALANGIYMPKAQLSTVSQQMYDCVASCVLDTDDFPDFSKAIQQSIQDGWCKKRLIEKNSEFSKINPNINETYLRITIGENNGESPGIPYVMEIWPAKHYSPVHSHAGSEAVIKVLHGKIHVTLFPFLGGSSFGAVDFDKEDVTWISPYLNQIHQLKNCGTDVCITIQCYMYDQRNHTHYDYFDYLDDANVVKQYEPDSDMDFVQFKELMHAEWESRKPNKFFGCFLGSN